MAMFPECPQALSRDLGLWAALSRDGSAAAGMERVGPRTFEAWLSKDGNLELFAKLTEGARGWEATELRGPLGSVVEAIAADPRDAAARAQSVLSARSSDFDRLWEIASPRIDASMADPVLGGELGRWDSARSAIVAAAPAIKAAGRWPVP